MNDTELIDMYKKLVSDIRKEIKNPDLNASNIPLSIIYAIIKLLDEAEK